MRLRQIANILKSLEGSNEFPIYRIQPPKSGLDVEYIQTRTVRHSRTK